MIPTLSLSEVYRQRHSPQVEIMSSRARKVRSRSCMVLSSFAYACLLSPKPLLDKLRFDGASFMCLILSEYLSETILGAGVMVRVGYSLVPECMKKYFSSNKFERCTRIRVAVRTYSTLVDARRRIVSAG